MNFNREKKKKKTLKGQTEPTLLQVFPKKKK